MAGSIKLARDSLRQIGSFVSHSFVICLHREYLFSRSMGCRLNIVIVAEGAIDRDGQAITSDIVITLE